MPHNDFIIAAYVDATCLAGTHMHLLPAMFSMSCRKYDVEDTSWMIHTETMMLPFAITCRIMQGLPQEFVGFYLIQYHMSCHCLHHRRIPYSL